MQAQSESSRLAEALRDYLPELTSVEIRDHLRKKLVSEVINARPANVPECEIPLPSAYRESADIEGKFFDYFAYYVRVWGTKVEALASEFPVVAPDNRIWDEFVDSQAKVVSGLMMRTLLEELHLRRVDGLLLGETAEERYRSFRRWTNSRAGHEQLTKRYPLLFQIVRERVRSAADYVVEIVAAVEHNRLRLAEEIPGAVPGAKIAAIELGQGDTHNGGRCVAQIVFSNGDRILYKPRPMKAEAGFNQFVKWINDRIGTRLRTVSVLLCETGGFVEYAATSQYSGSAEEYFAQLGQLTGILYLLRATDIHHENVIIDFDGPVVVDTETLLTPRLRRSDSEGRDWGGARALQDLQDSVIGIGILPIVMRPRGTGRGMDVGVIGYDAGQLNPFRTFAIRNPGRDDMFVELIQQETSAPGLNQSVHEAAQVSAITQRDVIKREFRRIVEYARAQPDDVIGAIEACFGDARFRFVTNATVVYAQLLRMATHPDAIRDPLVRATILNRVILLSGISYEVSDEESRQLAAGDVPYFSRMAGSCALEAGGAVVEADAFEESGLDAVRDQIRRLDAHVIDREWRMIDLAFVSRLPAGDEPTGFVPSRHTGPATNPSRVKLVAELRRLGDRIMATMIDGDAESRPATWIAPQIIASEGSQWTPGVLEYDIYGGSSGIAIVLAGLARETGDFRYGEAALRVIEPFEEQLRRGALRGSRLAGAGGMGGLAGAIYAVSTARRLLELPGTVNTVQLASELTETSLADNRSDFETVEPDFVSGLAGTLAVSLAIWRNTVDLSDRAQVESVVRTVAEWEMKALGAAGADSGRVTDFTGYAHGAMGIGPVLLEYGAIFDDLDARDLGSRIVGAVNDVYDEHDRDWPRGWSEVRRSYGWCHGAPGMLLGALTAAHYAPSTVSTGMLSRLADLTVHRGFGSNPSYCHGDLGSVEVIALAQREMPGLVDSDICTDLYAKLFVDVIERYDERADTRYAYSNSLMLGSAGFAWSILRYLDPDAYPCVLRFG